MHAHRIEARLDGTTRPHVAGIPKHALISARRATLPIIFGASRKDIPVPVLSKTGRLFLVGKGHSWEHHERDEAYSGRKILVFNARTLYNKQSVEQAHPVHPCWYSL
jgi:hypothetical protein